MEEILQISFFIMEGIKITLLYSICGIIIGICFSLILSFINYSKIKALSKIYVSIFRGTPLLIQLYIAYYVVPQALGVRPNMFIAGGLAFGLNSAAYLSEILRSGIESVENGQIEAAKAIGISKFSTIKDIVLPQAFRNIFPSLVNELINLIKESAIISFLGGQDIMRNAQLIAGQRYEYMTPMLIAASVYYLIINIISFIARYLERIIKI